MCLCYAPYCVLHHTAPAVTVTVNNTANAVAGMSHTLSCSVTGVDLQGATISYVWQLNGVNILQATSSMLDIALVQVADAGSVYTCQVIVTASNGAIFGSSGSGILMVSSKLSLAFSCTILLQWYCFCCS